MKNSVIIGILVAAATTSCVSKKKYVAMENNYRETQSLLTKTTFAKEELENKFAKIEQKVAAYNQKINSLSEDNKSLSLENANKLDLIGDSMVMSKSNKEQMSATLAQIDPEKVAQARTLQDSINLAVSHNLTNKIGGTPEENEDIDISVDETVVMINISDKLLFNTGSYRVNRKAYPLLEKLATVIKSEPSMDVMIEGHTDSRTINTAVLEDNWDLSVKRATSIIRILQNKYDVNPAQLIASGRSSYMPLVENNSSENRAKNRRTRLVILPNLGKFFSMMASNGDVQETTIETTDSVED